MICGNDMWALYLSVFAGQMFICYWFKVSGILYRRGGSWEICTKSKKRSEHGSSSPRENPKRWGIDIPHRLTIIH